MSITNINNDHFDDATMSVVKQMCTQVANILAAKTRNLSPEERKSWGSINEQNKLVPLKVLELAENQPELKSPDVNYEELMADWKDSLFLRGIIAQMMDAVRIADNIRITHDWDAYQASKQDYRHAEYKTGTDGGAGFENKYGVLKQFFTTNDGSGSGDEEAVEPDGPAK